MFFELDISLETNIENQNPPEVGIYTAPIRTKLKLKGCNHEIFKHTITDCKRQMHNFISIPSNPVALDYNVTLTLKLVNFCSCYITEETYIDSVKL